jgi:autotransporter-associated beta strand protein
MPVLVFKNMMNRILISGCKIIFLAIFLLLTGINGFSAVRTASVTGNWNATATWGGSAVPTAADNVTINSGVTVTVTANATCLSLTNNGILTTTTFTITVAGTWVNNGTFNPGAGIVTFSGATAAINAGTGTANFWNIWTATGTTTVLTLNTAVTAANNVAMARPGNGFTSTIAVGSRTLMVTGILSLGGTSSGRNTTITVSTGTVSVTGNFTAAGNNNPSGSRFTFTGAGTLNVGGGGANAIPQTNTAWTFTPGTSTVNFTSSSAQTIGTTSYYNLTLSGGGTKTLAAATPIVSGILTVRAGTTLALGNNILGATTAPSSVVLETGTTGSVISGTGSLRLGGNISVNNTSGSGGATISCPTSLNGNRTITVANDGSSAIDLTISGVISTAFGIIKAGAGTLELSGSNTYTGTTTVGEGILRATTNTVVAAANGAFGNNASGLYLAGGTIQSNVATFSRPLIVTATNSGLDGYGSARTISSTITHDATASAFNLNVGGTTVGSAEGQNLTLSGIISNPTGTLAISKIGSSTVIINATNTYTGGSTLTSGTLQINNVAGFGIAGQAVRLNGGILDLFTDATVNGYNITVGGAATILSDRATTGAGITHTLGTLSIGAFPLTIRGGNSATSGITGVTFGATTFTGAPTFTITNGTGTSVARLSVAAVTNGANTATINGNGSMIQSGVWGNGSGGIIYGGSGSLTLNQSNTFTGGVTLNSGLLTINNNQALGASTGTFTILGGTIDATIAGISTVANPLALNGDFIFTGTNSLNLGTGAVTINANRQITTTANTLTIGGTLSSVSNSLTKAGAGILSFASNTVTLNSLTIGTGTLISTSGTLNLAGDFTNNGSFTANNGTVNLNGAAKSVGGTAVTTFNNLTLNNTGGASLGAAVTVTGILTLTNGILTTTGSNLISVTNTGSSAVTGGSATSFINGPIKWTLPASLGSGFTYTFPVGKGTTFLPFALVNPTTGTGAVTAQVEAYTGSTGGSFDATLTSLSATEYWSLVASGNFTNSSLTLSRPSTISPLDEVGGSPVLTGPYTSLNGITGPDGIIGSDPIGSNRFFALAVKRSTITTITINGSPFCAGATGVSVPFTYNPRANFSGATFTAQLSDATGSFTSPVVLESVASNGTGSQSLNVTIPLGTPAGTGYRIRIVSTNPAFTGSDNGADLIISGIVAAQPGAITGSTTPCANTAGISYSVPNVSGVSYTWIFPTGWIQTGGGTTSSVTVTTGASSGNIVVTPTNSCGSGTPQTLAVSVVATPAITVQPSTTPQSVCQNGTLTSFSVTASGATSYQWYKNTTESNSGGTLLTGATSSGYLPLSTTIGTLYYYCVVSGACSPDATSAVSGAVTVIVPELLIATPASRCGTGTLNLSVTRSGCLPASTVNWYSAVTGGTLLATNTTSYTTPGISTTTTYYAQESFQGGMITPGAVSLGTSVYGLAFDLNEQIVLNSVQVNAIAVGSVTIQLQNNAGAVISTSASTTVVTGTNTIALNWTIPAGSGYRLVKSAGVNLGTTTTTVASWPVGFTVGSITSSIEAGTANSLRYDYFYNWSISRVRVPVTATVGAPIVSGFSGSSCDSGTVTLGASASSGTITWYDAITGGNVVTTGTTYSPTLSTTTTYYVAATDGSCTSTPRIPVTASIVTKPTITAGGNGAYCAGSTVNLTSSGSGITNRYWTGPNGFYSLLDNPVLTNVTPEMTGTYTVIGSALSSINLVSNGDFESGNTGFVSSYGYATPAANVLQPEGVYTVVADPKSVHDGFTTCSDHSSTGTLQMVVNGATVANVNIWSQTVNVVPNTYYQYTYWIQSVVASNAAELQLYINGSPAGPIYIADTPTCSWKQFTYNWNSGSSTTAYLSLINHNTAPGGNDFALDDIVFKPACTTEDPAHATADPNILNGGENAAYGVIYVTVSATPTAGVIGTNQSICSGATPATLTSITAGTGSGTISYEWQTNASSSYVTIAGATAATYSSPPLTATTSYQRRTVSTNYGTVCTSPYTTAVTISVSSSATAVAGGPDVVCESASPTPITLSSASVGGSATTGAWSILSGGGSLSNYSQTVAPATVTYTPSVNYSGPVTLRLTTNNVGGCSAIADRTITIRPTPTVTISGTTSVCENATNPTITFTNPQSLPVTVTYTINGSNQTTIDVGSGTTATEAAPTATSGSFAYNLVSVVYQIAPACENAVSGTATVTVNPNLAVSISISPSENPVCSGTSVTFTATPTNGGTVPNYQWKVNGINVGTNSATYTYSPVNSDEVTCELTSSETCVTSSTGTSNSVIMAVTLLPVATFSYTDTPYCPNAINPLPTFSGGGIAGTFSSTSGLVFVSTSTGEIDLAASIPDNYLITNTIAASGGCGVVTATSSVTINPDLPVSVSIVPSANPVCSGISVTFTATPTNGGATPAYQWKVNDVNVGTNSPTYSYTPINGDVIACVMASNAACATGSPATSDVLTMTVDANLPVSIVIAPSANPVCSGTSVTFTATPTNEGSAPTYQWKVNGTNSGTNSATFSYSPANGDAVTCELTSNATCTTGSPAASNTLAMTVNPNLPVSISIVPSANPVCEGTSVTYTATPTNGGTTPTYQWKVNGTNAGTNSATYVYTPINSDAVTCVLTSNANCATGSPATSNSLTMSVTLAPVATFSYTGTPYCSNGLNPTPTFSGSGVAGTFSSTAGLVFISTATGQVNLAASTPGTYTVTNTINASGGCSSTFATSSITITTLPAAIISYTGIPFCKSLAADQLVTRTGTTGGAYTASPAGLTINGSTGAITPGTSTAGAYTVTYTIAAANGCSAVTATTSVTITAVPTAIVSYAGSPFCSSINTPQAVTLTGTGAYTGGTYSSTAGLSINSSTGAITPNTSTTNTYTVTYTIPASLGCPAVPATVLVTVTSAPVATFGYSGTPYCSNGTNPSPTFSGGGAAGTFSSTAGLVFVSTSTGQVNLAASTPGTYTVTNTINASGGCLGTSATGSITITALPTATISYAGTPFCKSLAADQLVTLSGTGAYTGGAYSSGAGLSLNSGTGAINPGASTAGTYTVTYTIAAADGCGVVTATTSVTITAVPTATISYAGTPFCKSLVTGQAVTLSGTGAYTGGVYSSTAGLTINSSTGAITPGTSTAGIYTVTYTIPSSGGCASVPVTTSVTITTLPVATFSYTGTPYCSNAANPLPTFSGGGVAGVFSSTAGLNFVSTSTGEVNLTSSTKGTTYTVTNTIAAAGGCSLVSSTGSIRITALPAATISYAGTPFCKSVSLAQSITRTGTTGGTYTASPAGLSISSSSGAITPSLSTAGAYTVTYSIAATGGCSVVTATTSVTITAVPTATISYSGTPFCKSLGTGQAVTISGTGAYTGGTYSSTAGLTINSSSGAITPGTSTAGTYSVTYTIPASGGCAAVPATTSVTITAVPTATISYAGTPFCKSLGTGQAVTLSGTAAYTGGAYSSTAGLTIDSGTGAITPGTSTPGTYTVTYTIPSSGGCAAVPATTSVTITAVPTATISYAGTPFCTSVGTAQPVTLSGTAAYTGGSYSSTAGLTINSVTGAITPGTSTAGIYTVTYTIPASGGCATVPATTSVTITALPNATISYAGTPFCKSLGTVQPVTLSGTAAYTGGSFSSTAGLTIDPGTGAITPGSSTAGVYTITYTIPASGGCATVPATTSVTITAVPTATISYSGTPFCNSVATGQPVTLSGTAAYMGGAFSSTAGLSISSSTGAITPGTSTPGNYTVTYTIPASGGCASVPATTSITITALPVATFSYTATPYCSNGTNPSPAFSGGGVAGTFSAVTGLNFVSTATGEVNLATSTAGTYTLTNTIAAAGGCAIVTATSSITITALPTATISYAGTPYCSNFGVASVSRSGNTGGTYSATPAGLAIDSGTGAITTTSSTAGTYTVSYTIPSAGGCGIVTATCPVTINLDGRWTGSSNTDWNTTSNWACNELPTLTTDVIITTGLTNYPTLSSGNPGRSKDLSIQNSSTVTVNGNTLQIAGAISNSGVFTATDGTIEIKGSAAQTIGANTFAGNTIQNLTITNLAGVTLSGALNVTGIVKAATGNLSAGVNLTLISTAAQTALIDGSGSGQVLGTVTMQRYIPTAFGYKYVSSPFSNLTVAAFTPFLSGTATIPTFYSYDENKVSSGWVSTPSGTLTPGAGYAANLGSGGSFLTLSTSGTVNNGNVTMTLYNHNKTYTQGFNLVGNPYPSPIDWDASGWQKTNMDASIHFFHSGGTDQYTGTYTSYVNGVGDGSNIIPSMQGFFVHVNALYPSTGTLGFTNSVRTTHPDPTFKVAKIDDRVILRFAANFETKNATEDVAIIYFDNSANLQFDRDKDALKMLNTDLLVPNLYSITAETKRLAINGMPLPTDSLTRIPLGLNTLSDGWITFKADDIARLSSSLNIYLVDKEKGVTQDLRTIPEYRFYLKSGIYNQRFSLIFSYAELNLMNIKAEKMFSITSSASYLSVKINLPFNTKGNLMVTNVSGQVILRREVYEQETIEVNPGSGTGLYIITVSSGNRISSQKVLIRKDYE